jgi:acetyl esterase/lipase
MGKHLHWLLFLLVLSACQKETEQRPDGQQPVTTLNVAYGTDQLQKLDLYLPANRSLDTTKVIILIHGGAWAEGDKTDFDSYVPELKQRLPGYAVFNLNYRLYVNNTNRFPAQEEDIKAAVNFIFSRRNEYYISDKFVLLGASAGGHLALLQGNKYSTPVKPKAIVSFFGPTDLVSLYNTSQFAALGLPQITGGTPTTAADVYKNSSPSNYITTGSPPTMLLQGGLDPLVPPAQSELLRNLLQTSGVINEYVFYPFEAHGWEGANLQDSFDKIGAFLKTHVQ